MLSGNLKNGFTKKYQELAASGASNEELRNFHADHSLYYTQLTGDIEQYEIMCGQGAGIIKSMLGVAEIVEDIIKSF